MYRLKMISFFGFLTVALILAVNGIVYFIAGRIMPYHLIAMETSWEKLSSGIQLMSLSFMKSAGAGFITTSIAMLFILFFPFRKNELWSYWALLLIPLNELCLVSSRIIIIRVNSLATPPIIPFIILIILAILSFIFAIKSMKGDNKI